MMKKFFSFITVLIFLFQLHAEQPVFRAGIITDTHVTEDKRSCDVLKDARTLDDAVYALAFVRLNDVAGN